jgi:hypothetical protein
MVDLNKDHIEFQYVVDYAEIPGLEELDGESKVTYYEELLSRALIMRANERDPNITEYNQEKIFPYIKHILEWLRRGDFYTCPASTQYHDACYAGLLTHTLSAYNQLVALREVPKFKVVKEEQWWSAVFAILVHDWCKIGRYESYLKNVKNEATDTWEKVPAYKYREDGVGRLGHATQSLVVAMQLCNSKYTSLTFEEIASIRWHMDNWDMTSYDAADLNRCNNKIPMVRMVQFADQLAVTEY